MRKYGLVGFPLSHSWSKKYFEEKFRSEKIANCSYDLYPLRDLNELPALLDSVGELCGLNVTIPHKSSIIALLDQISDEAGEIGAVNVLKIRRTGNYTHLSGFNSDVTGFTESLRPFFNDQKNALVLGTGGSSKAVVFSLEKLGMKVIKVSRYAGDGNIVYNDIDEALLKGTDIIVNTTPVGMFPDVDGKPAIPYRFLRPDQILYDLVYNPELTSFMKAGQEMGCTVVSGYEMLRIQAEKAWEIWNDDSI